MNRRVILEIPDLDSLTKKDEIQDSLERSLKVSVLERNKLDIMRLAVTVTNQEEADRLEKLGCMKIGFMFDPIRSRFRVVRSRDVMRRIDRLLALSWGDQTFSFGEDSPPLFSKTPKCRNEI